MTMTSTNAPESPPGTSPRRRRGILRPLAWAIALAAVAGLGYAAWSDPGRARSLWASLTGPGHAPPSKAEAPPPAASLLPDGRLAIEPRAVEALGLTTVAVEPQTRPIRIELLGTTGYVEDALSRVRLMFKGRVDKVNATVGQAVKKGDPLVEIYSTELAAAVSAYEIERIQWLYDKNLLESREALVKTKAVSEQLVRETRNNEMKNRRESEVARDKLLIYGLSEAEIDALEKKSGAEKARMTLRAPADGMIVARDVVPGNLYDENDTLLTIAPMEQLWVWGHVFESDVAMVHLGQGWDIRFPFRSDTVRGKVEYISNRVDPDSHAVRIRTSIPNPGGTLKADMLVRGSLEIPPEPGTTSIPRTALVVSDGHFLAFVEVPGPAGLFERRTLSIVQEKEDRAVVSSGLAAGERVASVGALILAQLYEDLQTAKTGAPSPSGGAD